MGAGLENLEYNRAAEDSPMQQAGVLAGSSVHVSCQWLCWKPPFTPQHTLPISDPRLLTGSLLCGSDRLCWAGPESKEAGPASPRQPATVWRAQTPHQGPVLLSWKLPGRLSRHATHQIVTAAHTVPAIWGHRDEAQSHGAGK